MSRRTSAQLLSSKLTPPQLSPSQVLRTDLCDRICGNAGKKLVLIEAPAGFGKTTLMLQAQIALSARDVRTAWLTVDAADNDVGRFIGFLSAAVAMLLGKEWQLKQPSRDVTGLIALGLLDDIAAAPMHFALFIDDLEELHSPASCSLLRQVINQLPEHGQVIIGSRGSPELGIAELRAQGQVLEIHSVDLRFSLSEAADLLQSKCVPHLPTVDVARLHRLTEGLPAGLLLASLALERCPQPSELAANFSSSNVAIAEYFAEEILTRLSPRVRDFLTRTSILTKLNASLCDALLDADDSAVVLDELKRAGLVLQVGAEDRGWLRYHSLFASFLRVRLERLHPQALPKLHRAASFWFRAQRWPIPAIEHAFAAGDVGYALPLLDRQAEQLLQDGRIRLLVRLLDSVAGEELAPWPRLRLIQTCALSMVHGARHAMPLLECIEAQRALDEEARSYALALRPMLLGMMDRFDTAYAAGRQALAQVRPAHVFAFSLLRTTLANLLVVMGRYASARELLDQSQAMQRASGGRFMSNFAQCVDGVIDLLHGRLQQATARFRDAAGIDAQRAHAHTSGNTMAGLLLAEALYEQNELAVAERLLNVYLPLVQEIGPTDHLICGYRNLTRIAFHRGDKERALQLVTQMERLGRDRASPRLVASAQLERARLALWDDDLQAAGEALERASVALDWSDIMGRALFGNDADTLVEGRLRLMIHSGAAADAVPELTHELGLSESARRLRRALRLRVLLALALERSGNGKQALRTLVAAIPLAEEERFVRTFLDEGEPLARLLRKLTAARMPVDATDELTHFKRFMSMQLGQGSDRRMALADAAETTTRNEVEILHLVSEGLSNSAIAQRLLISEATVRTHLRSINAKFATRSRTQAVAVARRLKLVD